MLSSAIENPAEFLTSLERIFLDSRSIESVQYGIVNYTSLSEDDMLDEEITRVSFITDTPMRKRTSTSSATKEMSIVKKPCKTSTPIREGEKEFRQQLLRDGRMLDGKNFAFLN